MKKILLVEDELPYIQLLKDLLTSKGYEVIVATDGKAGLSRAISINPDLIILDIKMPVMDGVTMLDLLRKNPKGKSMKVIMLTNIEPSMKIINNTIEDHLTHYFVKSDTKFADLLGKIKEVLTN